VSCLPKAPDTERQKAIITVILEVELVKMLNPPLTPQQRHALMLLLADTGKSVEEIADLGRKVMERKTFNTLAFEHWTDEADVELPKAKLGCVYCGTEYWGRPNTRCPKCYSIEYARGEVS
jgi:predicted Zn-ribbon and HTH transcriptional regulator